MVADVAAKPALDVREHSLAMYHACVPDDLPMCSTCATLRDQDALQIVTLEILQTIHNACAPVTHYLCRCRTCATRWLAIEVFDEEGQRASEWSWAVDRSAAE